MLSNFFLLALDHIVIRISLLLLFEQILQRNALQISLNHLLQPPPHRKRRAEFAALTARSVPLQAGNRRQTALRQFQNLAYRLFTRRAREPIPPLRAAVGPEKIRTMQHRHNLFQIFFRYVLSPRDVLEGNETVILMFRKINHHAQRIASFC